MDRLTGPEIGFLVGMLGLAVGVAVVAVVTSVPIEVEVVTLPTSPPCPCGA
jgi:hypothetical protein